MGIKYVLLGFTTNLLNLTDEIPDWVSIYQNTGLLLSYSCIFDWLACYSHTITFKVFSQHFVICWW